MRMMAIGSAFVAAALAMGGCTDPGSFAAATQQGTVPAASTGGGSGGGGGGGY